jgi:hypothetical protein
LPRPRRIVTGHDEQGRSVIIDDGPSPVMLTVEARPGFRNHNIWRTEGACSPANAPDTIAAQEGVLPPPGGTVIRVIDYPPMPSDPEARRRQAASSLRTLFADADHLAEDTRPGMHRTLTVDYAIVLTGKLTAVLEESVTEMGPGDILIQRATNHAWENRTSEMARILFVLIDAS